MYKPYDVEIEYLESTGTQWINTGIPHNTRNIEINMRFQWNGSDASTFETFVGYMNASGTTPRAGFHKYTSKWMFGTNYTNTTTVDVDKNIHELFWTCDTSSGAEELYIDGTKIAQNNAAATGISGNTCTFYLFARNRTSSVDNKASVRIMSFNYKAFGEDSTHTTITIKRDFIPVRVGNVGYMYDKISCQLFGNSGTGSFTLGPDMYDSKIEYLQATGTQWIDTEVDYDSTVRIMTSMRINNSAARALFGIYYNNGTAYRYSAHTANSTNRLYAYCGTITNKYTTLSLNTWYTIELDNRYLNVNGSTTDSAATTFTTDDNPVSIYIFGRHNVQPQSSVNTVDSLGASLFRYMRIWKNGLLVRDFIPVRKGEVGYLYDNVSNRLFGNSGTGTFTLGRDVEPIPTSYDAQVQYIKFTGHQFIDTGVYGDLNTKITFRCYPTPFNLSTHILSANLQDGKYIRFIKASGSRYYISFGDTVYNYTSLPTVAGNNWMDVLLNNTIRRVKAVNKTGYVADDREVTTTFTTSGPLILGGYNGTTTTDWTNYRGYIAFLQIRNATGLIRDFIPVRKNGVGYLYDRVTGNMFGNDGAETIGYGPDILQPVPASHGEGTTRYYTRRDIIHMYQEQVYNCVVSWQSNDTHTSTTAQLYHGQRYKYEDAWGAISRTTFTFWATSYTGRHKTLNVIAGQKYKIKANPVQNTVLVFCNDHVWSASKKLTGIQSATVIAGTEAIVTVPSGYSYMMVGAATSSGSTLILPDRITRLVAYG